MQFPNWLTTISSWRRHAAALRLRISRIGFTLIAAGGISTAVLADESIDPNLSVENPFSNSEAIDRLRECMPDLSADTIKELSHVQLLYYKFEPPVPVSPTRRKKFPDTVIARTVKADVPGLSAASIAANLAGYEKDDCELRRHISGAGVTVPTIRDGNGNLKPSREFDLSFHYSQGESSCGWFFGLHYSEEQYSLSMDVNTHYKIGEDWSLQSGQPQVSNKVTHVNRWAVLPALGALATGMGNVLASPFTQSIKAPQLAIVGSMSAFDALNNALGMFTAMIGRIRSVREYLALADEDSVNPLVLDSIPDRSGLENGSNGIFALLTQEAVIKPGESITPQTELHRRLGEIKFWKDLSEGAPREVTVARGENLWRLARDIYPDPRMFIIVEQQNGLRGKKLRVGQVIRFPRLYAVCNAIAVQKSMVRLGDSAWELAKRSPGIKLKGRDFRSGRIGLIYPYEQMPSLPASSTTRAP